MHLITGGEGYVYHHNQQYHLKAGKIHLIPGFTLGSYHCDDYLEQYYIHFSNEMDGWMEIFVDQQCDYHIDAIDLDYLESIGILKQLLSRFFRGGKRPPDDEKTQQLSPCFYTSWNT